MSRHRTDAEQPVSRPVEQSKSPTKTMIKNDGSNSKWNCYNKKAEATTERIAHGNLQF
jgi:hypothetical protein